MIDRSYGTRISLENAWALQIKYGDIIVEMQNIFCDLLHISNSKNH